jgi:hypothetical protein
MTPLIEKHFHDLQFDLRLKFKAPLDVDGETWPEAYVGADGPVKTAREALYFTAGPLGEGRHFLVRFMIEDSGIEWLRNVPERHLEVVSELGEM